MEPQPYVNNRDFEELTKILANSLRKMAHDLEDYGRNRSLRNPPPAPTIEPHERLLKTAEVAERLQLSRAKVYQMIVRQELPSITIGRSRRVRQNDLEVWIANQ